MQYNTDFLAKWEQIVNDVDKDHVPIDCVKKIIFRTRDRRQKTINLQRLRRSGFDIDSIENAVTNYINENDESIISMDFVVDVEAVAEIVQPETDKLLKGI